MARLQKIKMEFLVPLPKVCEELMMELCRLMVRIQLMANSGKTIRPEYQVRFEKLKQQFLRKMKLPIGYSLENFSLDSEAFLDAEEHEKLRLEVEGMT